MPTFIIASPFYRNVFNYNISIRLNYVKKYRDLTLHHNRSNVYSEKLKIRAKECFKGNILTHDGTL